MGIVCNEELFFFFLPCCRYRSIKVYVRNVLCLFLGPEEVDFKCTLNYISCIGTNKCIHLSQLCNGVYDCSDGYDEGVHCRGE